LKSEPADDTHLNGQPMRLWKAAILGYGARETATTITS
jgi:hypothetical protein